MKEIKEAENETDQNVMPACNEGTPHASTSEENYDHHRSNNLRTTGGAGTSDHSDHQQLSFNCHDVITQEEVVEQVEPGVYITITFSRIGDKNLRRIRFRYMKIFKNVYK